MNPGDIISRYRIVARIGAGGMGVVYRAEDTRLQRTVALKFLPPDSFNEQSKQRFLNEARAAAQARHPNICPIYDIEEAEGQLFIVMAYLEGEALARKIERGPLEPVRAVAIGVQVAEGLACAHALGIIHRDIKASNIMVDSSGLVSIVDFGLALAPDATRVTNANTSVGTPAYMSPEQMKGEDLDARTDLWSLGVVMFEMLTGSLPFGGNNSASVIHAILYGPIPEISALRPGLHPELHRIISKALARETAARWASAWDLAAALKRLDFPTSEAATQPIPIPVPTEPRKRVPFAAVISILIAVFAGMGVFGYLRWKGPETKGPAPRAALVPAVKHVAVLPFQVSGSDQNTGRIADGMFEILTSALQDVERIRGSVTAVPASDVQRRGITTPEQARRFYGVNFVITGNAQPTGEKVEFTVNLVDAATLQQISTRNFIFDPKKPLVSRDQAITQVARMLDLEVPAAAKTAIAMGDSGAPDAYSAYLEGRGLLARYDIPTNVDLAIASFEKAIRQDPKYALAYAGLGEAYWRKARTTGDKQWATLANQNAEHAVQLDGNLAIAHSVLGSVYVDAGRQEDAIREFKLAMEHASSNAEASLQLAEVYKTLGRFDEAEALYVRATKSRPTDWYGHLLLGMFYYERERYPEAEAELNQAKSLTPDNDLVRRDLGAVYRMHGRYQEAIDEYQQALRIRSNSVAYAALGGAYYFQHRFAEAVSAVEAAIDLDSNDYRYWGNLGAYSKWAPGNEAKSAPALRRAIELAEKFSETRKSDYSVRADLAEYRARLGDAKGALAEIERIPQTARGPFTARLALAYQLTGQQDKAVQVVRTYMKNPATLNQIKDDPDLAPVWRKTNSK